jgi:hypothetical protein
MSHKPPSPKLQQLRKLVQEAIENDPFERDDFQWAALPQRYYCQKLEISPATLRRWIARPPFVRQHARIDGKVTTLLREGEAGPLTPRHIANTMAIIWRETTGRRASPKEYGCLVGLAESWPQGAQIDLLRMVLKEWPLFMSGVDSFIAEQNAKSEDKLVKRYYEFPSLAVIRRFASVALEVNMLKTQEAGKTPHPVIKALNPNTWPKYKILPGSK